MDDSLSYSQERKLRFERLLAMGVGGEEGVDVLTKLPGSSLFLLAL